LNFSDLTVKLTFDSLEENQSFSSKDF